MIIFSFILFVFPKKVPKAPSLRAVMGSVWWLLLCMPMLSPTLAEGVIRVYYLGIHEVDWNYAPTGKNVLANQVIASNRYVPFWQNLVWS